VVLLRSTLTHKTHPRLHNNKYMKGAILTGQTRLRFSSSLAHFGSLGRLCSQNHYFSLWFSMASVDIINFENMLWLGTR